MKRAVVALLAVGLVGPARAEPIELGDSKYASAEAYLAGTWAFGPRRLTFAPDGGVTYENTEQERTSTGRYEVHGTQVHISINRSCDKDGTCQTTDDPAVVDQPFKPVSADVFQSNSERWQRQK